MSDTQRETIQAMDAVLAKIGTHFGVAPGDVPGLLEAIEKQTNDSITMRCSLVAISRHYTPNWKPGDTHESTQKLSGIAHDALAVVALPGKCLHGVAAGTFCGICPEGTAILEEGRELNEDNEHG